MRRRVVIDQLTGVAATSRRSAWAIGTSAGRDFLLRWNGREWSIDHSLPDLATLAAISHFARQVWIVGATGPEASSKAAVFSWNGARWDETVLPVLGNLTAVAAASPRNVWASGLRRGITPYWSEPVVAHWNGAEWRILPAVPEPTDHRKNTASAIYTLSPSGSSGVWAGGNWNSYPRWAGDPLLDQWNGSRWRIVPFPRLASTIVSSVYEVSPADVWVAASNVSWDLGIPPRGYLEHWNGATWTRVAVPHQHPYADLAAIVGVPGTGARLIGWTGRRPRNPREDPFTAVTRPMVDALTCLS